MSAQGPELSAAATESAVAAEAAAEDHQPSKRYPPIAAVDNAALTKKDMLAFVAAAVRQQGLVGHSIDGFNELVSRGIDGIMTRLFEIERVMRNERTQTPADQKRESFTLRIQFHDVKVARPTFAAYLVGQIADLYPGHARATGLPYAGAVTLGATVAITARYLDGRTEEKTAEVPEFQIGSFPIMVGSTRCHTHLVTQAALREMGEDPREPGGYFIHKRQEYCVNPLENIRYNSPHFHRRMKPNEHVRAEFLSQPGGAFENSSQIRVRFMTGGAITIEINSTKFQKARLPFFVVYRLFGMTSDRAVAETIVFDAEDGGPVTLHMLDILGRAFHQADALFADLVPELNRERLVRLTAEKLTRFLTNPAAYESVEAAVQYLNSDLLRSLDKVLLPHIGQTAESRVRKLRFLGLLIHKTLLVHLKVLPPTDRDSYVNKRAHGPDVSLAKAFKTQVNNSIVIPIIQALRRELKNTPWEAITDKGLVDTFRGATSASNLNRAMEHAITAGNKLITVHRRSAMNRVASQVLERKNILNMLSALRTVVTQNAGNASKQTDRADKMRRAHPRYPPFICVSQSADTGENVGMSKQLGITATITLAGDALPLKLRLLADPAVTPLDAVGGAEMLRRRLARVFVNGEWIGCCRDAIELQARYRALRREGRGVDPSTSICWEPLTDEVEFWLDVGRLRVPRLIVDNNLAEYDAALRARRAHAAGAAGASEAPPRVEFVQNVRFTPRHAREIRAGRLTLADLVAEGVAEYHTPEETTNTLVAASIEVLRAARHDVTLQYTHCEVEQAIFGLAAHKPPFGNHTQPARVTYETNQGRQTGGWYALNWPFRTDKNRFFQFYNEVPLVSTLTDVWVPPNGVNAIIAYASYGGDNQEDSAIVCQASADRGMFAGAYFRTEAAELEKGEMFCTPDALTTKGLKPNASYEKLVDGFIRRGSVVGFGDVLIGRVAKIARGRAPEAHAADGRGGGVAYQFTDRSVIYRQNEPAVVEDVLRLRGANDEMFGVVKLRFERPLRTGDKLCLTPDHDVLTERGWVPIAAVTTADRVLCRGDTGVLGFARPDETHCFPVSPEETLYRVAAAGATQLVTGEHRLPVIVHEGPSSRLEQLTAFSLWKTTTTPLRRLEVPTTGWIGEFPCEGDPTEVKAKNAAAVSRALAAAREYDYQRRQWDAAVWRYDPVARDSNPLTRGLPFPNPRAGSRPPIPDSPERIFLETPDGAAAYLLEFLSSRAYPEKDSRAPLPTEQIPWLQALAVLAGVDAGRLEFQPLGGPWVVPRLLPQPAAVPYEVEPVRNPGHATVHCLSVPGRLFCVRRAGRVSWTGNSTRSGNKNIAALMLPQSDMPFTESGLTPDLIVNTHSVPSRMTIGQLIETSVAKVCARRGTIGDGTAFLPVDHNAIAASLQAAGFRFNGRERMYNGMTGEYFDAAIFIGPTAEQRLQKFVLDDEQSAAGSGPTDATTGQPLGGKVQGGGLRLGEMELWALQSHGAMANQYEKTSTDSDGRVAHVCRGCAGFAAYNEYRGIYLCRTCGEMADIAQVDSSKTALVFHGELAASNIQLKLGLRPREFEEPRHEEPLAPPPSSP